MVYRGSRSRSVLDEDTLRKAERIDLYVKDVLIANMRYALRNIDAPAELFKVLYDLKYFPVEVVQSYVKTVDAIVDSFITKEKAEQFRKEKEALVKT